MGYFVNIPKPKAWPPPRDGDERTGELLAYGYERDPVGDKVHTAFACLFLFCLPIDVYPTTIATWVLFIYSAMRLPSTWRTLTPICNSTIFRMMFVWAAWSLLSILMGIKSIRRSRPCRGAENGFIACCAVASDATLEIFSGRISDRCFFPKHGASE